MSVVQNSDREFRKEISKVREDLSGVLRNVMVLSAFVVTQRAYNKEEKKEMSISKSSGNSNEMFN